MAHHLGRHSPSGQEGQGGRNPEEAVVVLVGVFDFLELEAGGVGVVGKL